MDWASRVRTVRQRLHLKQVALAQLIGVSQTYISRLEAGSVLPPDDIIEALQRLSEDPRTRSPFDDLLALVRFSPFACFVARPLPVEGRLPVEAASVSMRENYLGTDCFDLADDAGLEEILAHAMAIHDAGLCEGRVLAATAPWTAPNGETVTLHYVPLRDGAGGCFIHASLAAHDGSDRLRITPADHLSATG
jgi:transcriptional regulator with XRE-family HTH domain